MNNTQPVIITTADVAQRLNMSMEALHMYLSRNPHLRPERRISGDDLLWSESEVEALEQKRAQRRRKTT